MGFGRDVHRGLIRKPKGQRPLGRPRRRWADNITMDFQELRLGGMEWNELAQDRNRWRTLVNALMHFLVAINAAIFLTSWEPVSFAGRTLLHGVSYQWNSFLFLFNISFFGAFVTELRIGTISRNCLSACLSVRTEQSASCWTDFREVSYFGFVLVICGHIPLLVKLGQMCQTLYVKTCTFVVSSTYWSSKMRQCSLWVASWGCEKSSASLVIDCNR